jgi:hypothetical protein
MSHQHPASILNPSNQIPEEENVYLTPHNKIEAQSRIYPGLFTADGKLCSLS